MARPSSYDPAYPAKARILCRLGADNAALARAFAVSPATLYRWLNAHPCFAAAAATGTAEAKAITIPTRFERATGYEVAAERHYRLHTATPVVARYKKRIPANPRAALRWLRARQPEKWRLGENAAWSHGAPWDQHAKKNNDSQNSDTIREVMISAVAEFLQHGAISKPTFLSLVEAFVVLRRESAKKLLGDVSSQNTSFTERPSEMPGTMISYLLSVPNLKPDFIEGPDPIAPPQPRLLRGEDQPQRPVPHRLRRIPRRGHRRAARVRMIMPDHRSAAAPRAPMRGEQGGRVYLERPRRVSRHIRGSLRLRDPPLGAV